MFDVHQTAQFRKWLKGVKDPIATAHIIRRIARFEKGNLGDVEPVGEGVSEARIHHGAGYRLYFQQHGAVLIILLCGGDKSTQAKDIERAKALAKEV
jgi:putative addiction module killer protein